MVRIIYIVIFFLVACSDKQYIEYYPSGGIKKERIYQTRDTSTYLQKTYFPNGQLESIGHYIKGNRDGFWQGWHEDGELSWTVEYENGTIKPPSQDPYWEVISFGKRDFQVGRPKKIRIYIEGVEPKQMGIMTTNAKVEIPSEDNDFYFVITPQKAGNMLFQVIYKEDDGLRILGRDSINVLPVP